MPRYRSNLPQLGDQRFICHAGMETDLIFNHRVPLPGFASFPLLYDTKHRALVRRLYSEQIELATKNNAGVILESLTWMANRDRAAPLGYTPDQLWRINRDAIALLVELRKECGDAPTVISGNIGPRSDAYAIADQMSPDAAQEYHTQQVAVFAKTEADLVSAYTIGYAKEAIGIANAAKAAAVPVVISFTVETDGNLPTGEALGDAIGQTDAATDSYPAYYMINCAHPEHFQDILVNASWLHRLKGLVVNASRCSHAELDEAEELDDGDPDELGRQMAALRAAHPHLTVLGGCCGTDARHLHRILVETAG